MPSFRERQAAKKAARGQRNKGMGFFEGLKKDVATVGRAISGSKKTKAKPSAKAVAAGKAANKKIAAQRKAGTTRKATAKPATKKAAPKRTTVRKAASIKSTSAAMQAKSEAGRKPISAVKPKAKPKPKASAKAKPKAASRKRIPAPPKGSDAELMRLRGGKKKTGAKPKSKPGRRTQSKKQSAALFAKDKRNRGR